MTVQMWLWILIGPNIVTKVHGYASKSIIESCDSMAPKHYNKATGEDFKPQDTDSLYMVSCNPGRKGDPVTVSLISTAQEPFKGFMLMARQQGRVDDSHPVGKFILLEPDKSKLLDCGGFADSAVMQKNNVKKSLVKVNWTAEEEELNITFRATFVKSFDTFWERVDVNYTALPENSTPTPSTTKPSTTELSTSKSHTTGPSTEALSTTKSSTAELSTTKSNTSVLSTAELSTTKSSTAELSTTKSHTTGPSTTKSNTTAPSTEELSTTELSTTKSHTTGPSTEALTTNEPSMTTLSSYTSVTSSTSTNISQSCEGKESYHQAGTALICFESLFMELSKIISAVTTSSFSHHLNKKLNTSGCVLCLATEISAFLLFYMGEPRKVILSALVIVLIVIQFLELVIVLLPIGPSHELKEICNLVDKIFSVTHLFFTSAVIFVGVLENDNCRKNWKECWLLKVMTAYTVWILLFVIWVFVSGIYRQTILTTSKIGNSKAEGRGQQRTKRKLSVAQVIGVSVILIAGTMAFTVAVIYGIFTSGE
ncbi:putative ferric-chelate reductase 1 isoform X2 [Channa argus]|uniref:putative ferric-chelate reductase 1 isoform X2 n=1 Tax=Channa argus TaxID=215402 RepID=UPI00352152C4